MAQVEEKMETITMEEAIAKGYTHFVEEEGEMAMKFSSVNEADRQYYKGKKCFVVDRENPLHYTISADTIKDMIADHVSEQDEVSDMQDDLYNIASEHDYSKLADELNEKFSKHKYWEPLDIQVIIG